ncbi:MAG: hypothetical protein CMF57_13060 [Leifsonia sp.]|jgi:hypothetical protein|nr:hypothetical protein [Leifsonia sp.]MBR23345.1 hypothetical protein [Leifsonia sp.]|tara:strand:+ start:1893 stop:2108 length:216 start_codon:yes stop_codon:yes gene_type:complete
MPELLGKPVWKSLTVWGLALWVAAEAVLGEVCAAGFASAELCATLDHWATIVSGVLVSLGIRRAATAPNTG